MTSRLSSQVGAHLAGMIWGTRQSVNEQVEKLAQRTGAQEILASGATYDRDALHASDAELARCSRGSLESEIVLIAVGQPLTLQTIRPVRKARTVPTSSRPSGPRPLDFSSTSSSRPDDQTGQLRPSIRRPHTFSVLADVEA